MNPSPDRKKNCRADIQILQGLAVFAVLLFQSIKTWFPAGYLGVDVFFVASEFIVTPLTNRAIFSAGKGKGSGLRSFTYDVSID